MLFVTFPRIATPETSENFCKMSAISIASDEGQLHHSISTHKENVESSIAPSRPFFNSNLIALLISGHVSACIGAFFAFPFEKVIIRKDLAPVYGSMYGGMKHIHQNEGGIRAFYRGMSFRFLRIATSTMPLIISDEIYRKIFVSKTKPIDFKGEAFAALLSGVTATIIDYPYERTRLVIQTALHEKQRQYTSRVFGVLRTEGIPFMYKGASRSMIGSITYAMILFPTFAGLKHYNVLNVEKQDFKSDIAYSSIGCTLALFGRRLVHNIDVTIKDVTQSSKFSKESLKKLFNWEKLVPVTMMRIPLISLSLSVIEFQKRYKNVEVESD